MYKVSNKLDDAIQKIFENPENGYVAVGAQKSFLHDLLGQEERKNSLDSLSPFQRIALLRRKLENWVELKAEEIDEFEDGPDTIRIYYEALSTLLVLGDLAQFFPEVTETASREELEKLEKAL